MEEYVCLNCKFRFKAEKVISCPYCAKNAIEKNKSAEDLLGEVGELQQ